MARPSLGPPTCVRALALACAIGWAAGPAAPSEATDPTARAAKIASAAASLELERAADAQRWLALVSEPDRDWSWRLLESQSDRALRRLHEDPEAIVAFAGRGEPLRLAAATADGRLLLLDSRGVRTLATGAEGSAAGEAATAIAFASDGERIAVALGEGRIRVVDFESGGRLAEWTVDVAGVGAVAWSATDDRIAIGGFRWTYPDPTQPKRRRPEAVLELFGADGSRLGSLETSGIFVGALAFSPDGSNLAAGAPQGRLDLFDLAGGRERRSVVITESRGFPEIEALAFSPDGARLGAACGDGTVHLWSTAGWEEIAAVETSRARGASATAIAFFPEGSGFVAGGTDAVLRVFPAEGDSASGALLGHRDGIVGVLAAPGGSIVSASRDGTVRQWSTQALEATLDHGMSVWGTAWSPDGSRFATAAADGRVRLWDCRAKRLLRTFEAHEGDAVSVVFGAEGRELVTTGNDGRLRLWSAEQGSLLAELEDIDDGRGVALALSPDGARLAAGSTTGTVKVWNLAARSLVATLDGHEGEVTQALWLPGGSRLVTAGADGEVLLWNVANATEELRFHAHEGTIWGAALSPAGDRLATAGDDRVIRLWDIATGRATGELRGHTERVWSLAWSPQGNLLASASNDATARVWDLATGLPLIHWTQAIQVYQVRWSPRGRALAIAPFDGRVRLLEAGP